MVITEFISNFFNDILKFDYEIPLNTKIQFGVIAITLFVMMYFYMSKTNPLTQKIMLWGISFIILNIITMIVSSYIYIKKRKEFIGASGEKGELGEKGSEGENITCKLCDYNIYLKKTNRFSSKNNISAKIYNMLYNQNLQINEYLDKFATEDIDLTRLTKDIFKGELKDDMSMIPNLIYKPQLVLLYNLNNFFNDDNIVYNIKTPLGPYGSVALSDTLITEKNEQESWVVNGDIRYPLKFEKLISIYTDKDNKLAKYDVLKMVPPEGYRGLGLALFQSYEGAREVNQYACLNEKCCKKAKYQDLKLSYILTSEEGFVSFWQSDYNTLHVNNCNINVIQDNKRLIEILFNYDEDIYHNSGSVKQSTYAKAEKFYGAIRLNNFTKLCYIINLALAEMNRDSKDYLKDLLTQLNIKLGVYSNSDIDLNNAEYIIDKMQEQFDKVESDYNKSLLEENKVEIVPIIDKKSINKGKLIRTTKAYITRIARTYAEIPIHLENTENALQLFELVFPDGLYTRIIMKELTAPQISYILLMKSLFPPNEDIYIPKNSCLVYEQIDEERNNLMSRCIDIIEQYNDKYDRIQNSDLETCSNEARLEITNATANSSEILKQNLSNIKNFVEKINSSKFNDFTNSQLEIILSEYSRMVDKMRDVC